MGDHPTPTPATSPPPSSPAPEYRLELNNWLQDRGWTGRRTWDNDRSDGPPHAPTWHAVCRCPFHSSQHFLDSYL